MNKICQDFMVTIYDESVKRFSFELTKMQGYVTEREMSCLNESSVPKPIVI